MQDDNQIFRLQQFDHCLKDGQIPCRYIPEGGLGYGYPLFNFYPPLPYAVAEIFHLLGFSFINSVKAVFILPNFIRAFSMYLFSATFFGPLGGLLSSVLYTLAPYQALNSFVRGALAEHWALSLFPLILFFFYQNKTIFFTLSLSALFLTHNLSTFYFLPLLALLSLLSSRFIYFLKHTLFSFCLSAFFLLPAIFEVKYVTTETMTQGYFYYASHFTTLRQLFIDRFWGYGASLWGPKDDMSFQVGYLHWLIPLSVILFVAINHKIKHRRLILTFFLVGLLALFLTHNRSTFIWQSIPLMPYFQFPWRFLGLAVLSLSFVSGSFPLKTNIWLYLIIFLIIILNINYFREDIWYPNLTDKQKLSGNELIRQTAAGLMDYWPKFSKNYPNSYASVQPQILFGSSQISFFQKSSRQLALDISVNSKTSLIQLPLVYYPRWLLTIDKSPLPYYIDHDLGLITILVPQGQHHLRLNFVNTPLRTLANLISLVSFLSLVVYLSYEKKFS
jgi:hypothetical protein